MDPRCREARITLPQPPDSPRGHNRRPDIDPVAETVDEGDKESGKSKLEMPKTEYRPPHGAEESLITNCRIRQKNTAQSASSIGYSTTGGWHSGWV
jgi:hypothetical protein